jgi:hypothetical protein
MESTPLPLIAEVSRLVTKVTDRITGDRSEFPLLVACVTTAALKHCGVEANIFYGAAAWVEVMENQSLMWVGAWGEHTHFWVTTQYGEVVDLNTSVSHRKRAHTNPDHQPKYSPPLLWSKEVPGFYKYQPEGLAEVELDGERDQRWFETCMKEILEKLTDVKALLETPHEDLDFPDEAILCPGRQILDDAEQSFRHYDRAILVQGLPEAPKL